MICWFKNIRVENHFSQSELAKKVNVSHSTINYIECGKRKPSPELAQKLGKVLGFDWTRFFTDVI